jgi:hypothetical protein
VVSVGHCVWFAATLDPAIGARFGAALTALAHPIHRGL